MSFIVLFYFIFYLASREKDAARGEGAAKGEGAASRKLLPQAAAPSSVSLTKPSLSFRPRLPRQGWERPRCRQL